MHLTLLYNYGTVHCTKTSPKVLFHHAITYAAHSRKRPAPDTNFRGGRLRELRLNLLQSRGALPCGT